MSQPDWNATQQQMAIMAKAITDLTGNLNDAGDNAWLMTSAALVYLMTPALAFFYGGMVDRKNVMGTLFLSFLCMGIVTVQWALFGFDLAFGPSTKAAGQLGGGGQNWEAVNYGLIVDPDYSSTVPFYTFMMYQCAFAVITPALISGAVVNKMKITTFCVFTLVWTTLVYDVLAFWVWNPQGWLHKLGALDWAGGTVIHIASGFSGLVCALMLGLEGGEVDPGEAQPHFTVLGAGLLWFGWLGFNAGAAISAGQQAGLAFANTNVAAASALLTWAAAEYVHLGKPTVTGGCVGAVVGLVVITPAAGYVRPGWALLMGIWGTIMVYVALLFKRRFLHKLDDPLDVFTCHGVGGVAGALLTGLFAEVQLLPDGTPAFGSDGAFYGNGVLFAYQIAAVVTAISYSVLMTAAICTVLHYTMGLRVSALENVLGMDAGPHTSATEAKEREKHKRNVVMRAIEMFSVGAPTTKLTPQEEAVLQDVFALFDTKGKGSITVDQFEKALSSVGLSRPKHEILSLVKRSDSDQSGAIDFQEFKSMFLVSRDEARRSITALSLMTNDMAVEVREAGRGEVREAGR